MGEILKNLHIPLPADGYEALRVEARRQGRPATQLAREAIAAWLEERRREEVERELARYVAAVAGSCEDLDPTLERAAAAELMQPEVSTRRRRRQ